MECSAKSTNTLTSSEDEDNQDCMPKIVNTISLQGCSTNLSFEPDPEDESHLLYPACEITEDPDPVPDPRTVTPQRKRAKLTSLPVLKPPKTSKPKPSTSKDDHYHVVDARKLALQESLFKTKELFGTFLRVCQDQENTAEMEKVVTKLSRAYDNTRPSYLGSMTFQNILEAETDKVNSANTKPWLNLKFVLDEMKSNKINSGAKLKLGESDDSQDGGGDDDGSVIECPKKRRHLKKLEKTLRQLNLKIKKLEEREVDFDDDNSAYVKLDRYRAQFTKVYTKVCEIKGKLADADRPYLRKVSFAGTTYPHINRCIERYYNKHREFPDFQDIKKLVTIANQQSNVDMPPIKVHSMAAKAFKEFGEMLKRLRQYDDYDVIISYLDQHADPALDDEKLQEQLTNNALLFKKREQEVIDRFAAEDAGIHSVSGQENEIKPKKKRKIVITTPRQKPVSQPESPSLNRHLSSSESSDDEEDRYQKKNSKPVSSLSSDSEDDKNIKIKKVIKSASSLSSSSEDSDDSESTKRRVFPAESSVKGKGKELIGKKRIIKRGVKPSKCNTPKNGLSSDEEYSPLNPKDTLTSYLGLKTTTKKEETDAKVKDESDDEIMCIKEIERSEDSKNVKSERGKSSSDSESSSKSLDIPVMNEVVFKSDDESPKSGKALNNGNAHEDSSSSIDIVQEVAPRKKIKIKNPVSALSKKRLNLSKSKQSYRTNSVSEGDHESNSVAKSKTVDSDSELSTQDLTSDSSDTDVDKKQNVSTIVLSEEAATETKPLTNGSGSKKQSEDSSDSDICILSQETKAKKSITRKMSERKDSSSGESEKSTSRWIYAPRKVIDPKDLPFGVNLLPTLHSRPLIAPRKVLPASSTATSSRPPPHRPATSTPKSLTKRRLSNQSNGVSGKRARLFGPARQSTLPQLMNGAACKAVITNQSRPPAAASATSDIPLIELD